MQNYPKEISEGISPLIFAVNGTDPNDENAESSSSFDYLIQHMTLAHKVKTGGSVLPVTDHIADSNNTADANSFFSRARFVTVSKTHAFPPSADPAGNSNRTSRISSVLSLRAQTTLLRGPHMLSSHSAPPSPSKVQYSSASVSDSAILSYLKRNPIEGILPEGWVEKHAHALPSVVVVVAYLDFLHWNKQGNNSTSKNLSQPAYYHQAMLEKRLSDLCDQIRSSLAEKRACSIHLVCIVPIHTTSSLGHWNQPNRLVGSNSSTLTPVSIASSPAMVTFENEKIISLRTVCKLPPGAISILHYPLDNSSAINTTDTISSPFQLSELLKLETALQEASLSYYRHQIKRIKDKLNYLQISTHPELLTAAARYSFKLALFLDIEERTRGSSNGVNLMSLGGTYGPFGFPKTRVKDASSSQGDHGSLKYWYDAYDYNLRYYRYLAGGTIGAENEHQLEEVEDNNSTPTLNGFKEDGTDLTQLELSLKEPSATSQAVSLDNGEVVAVVASHQELSVDPDDIEQGQPNINRMPAASTTSTNTYNAAIHSDDMRHQCRGFADWANYKILMKLSALLLNLDVTVKGPPLENPLAETDTNSVNNRRLGLLDSFAKQVRRHCGTFVTIEQRIAHDVLGYTTIDIVNHMQEPLWFRLLYSYQQRLFIAQVVERVIQPLYLRLKRESSGLLASSEIWDILCASSLYASVGDCILRLNRVINNEMPALKKAKSVVHDENRRKFVGSSNLFALKTCFQEESKRNYREMALDCMRRAVALREEMNKVSNKGKDGISAKYRYIIGLILMKDEKYDDAIPFFQVSLDRSQLFPRVHLAISKALVECTKSVSSNDGSKLSDYALPLVLNPQTSYLMASGDLLKNMTAAFNLDPHVPDTKSMDMVCCGDILLPISYSVTFPETVCAVQGDEVPVLVMLRSNIPFELQLNEIRLSTNLGMTHQIAFRNETSLPVLSQREISYFRSTITVPNLENFMSASDSGLLASKTSKPNSYGLSYLSGSVQDKSVFSAVTSRAIALQLSTLSLSLSLNDTRSRIVLLHLKTKHQSKSDGEMYISSSWNRPDTFPMKYGPSHVYMARPKAMIEVSNLTVNFNKGKVLEGTVNRIVFGIKPGSKETCRNMEFNVFCSNTLLQDSSNSVETSTSLLDQEETQDYDEIDRPPVLVKLGPTSDTSIPSGWSLYGENGRGTRDDWRPLSELVDEGSLATVVIDLFRPLSSYVDPEYPSNQDNCRTDIVLSIRYMQIRSDRNSKDGEWVLKEFHDSVHWCSPLYTSLSIVTDTMKSFPTGTNRHRLPHASTFVRTGDVVPVRCSVQAAQAIDGLNCRLLKASFSSTFDEHDEPCQLELIGNKNEIETSIIYEPKQNDVNSLLKMGTRISMLYLVRPMVKVSDTSAIFTRLGSLIVHWKPVPFPCPEGVRINDEYNGLHGPLPLPNIGPVVYAGPRCYVEETPFSVSMTSMINSPNVFVPFDVAYHFVNKIDSHQRIRIQFTSFNNASNQSIVFSGVSCGEIHLGPLEKKTLTYTMLAVRPGKTLLPEMTVSSDLCKSWVVHGGNETIILP